MIGLEMEPLRILTDEDVLAVHAASLQILELTGIQLTDPEGIDLLRQAGAIYSNGRLHFPPDMVVDALSRCPKKLILRGRGNESVILGEGHLSWHNLGGAREVYEPTSKTKRPALLQDIKNATLLLDALDSATTITPFFTPQDVAGHLMSVAMYRYALPYTIKPLQGPGIQNKSEVDVILRMAQVVGDPQEVLTLSVSPISPLHFPDQAVQAMMEIARHNVPFGSLPCPTAGATAPVTLAGAIAQQNAEVLASIVIVQSVNQGLPVIYCGRLAMMEPRSGISVWGGVELGLASAATVQVGHFYGLPVNVYGFSTNSHQFDIQSGFERVVNALLPALAGADELSGIGEMEAGVMGSYAQMVMDDEIAASIKRVLKGFEVNEETLALNVIHSVIENKGNFLSEPHTRRFLRKGEMQITRLAERKSWEMWVKDGFQDMASRACDQAEKILATHEVTPLDAAQEAELEAIYYYADRELGKC